MTKNDVQRKFIAAYFCENSKELRRDARRIIWPIAFGLSAGPGNFAWACLAGVLGFKLWDRFVAPAVQKDCETFNIFGARKSRQD